jgi:hypothetical protein
MIPGRARGPVRRLRKRVRKLVRAAQRRDLRRVAMRAFDARYRPLYRYSVAFVGSRDELPLLLNRRGLVGVGAEVGVRVGRFSEMLLTRWTGARLLSIDPWQSAPADEYVDHNNVEQAVQEDYHRRTVTRLARFGARSEVLRLTSLEAAEHTDDRTLDFVYIDARHDYDSVREDLHAWFPKLRPGGILAGHDYFDGIYRGTVFGVRRAVDEFCADRGLAVHATRERPPRFRSWIVQVPRAR